ncbi:hypothetical protein BG004_007999, partial [Podila humilis]
MHHQLYEEIGGVDKEAIEPRLCKLREICAQFLPDDIYNCDETGVYLKEISAKSHTIEDGTGGVKADRKLP